MLELAERALVGHIHAGVPPEVLERFDQVLGVLVDAGPRLEGRVDVLVLVPVHLYGRGLTGRPEQQVSCVRVDALVADEGRVELEREAGLGDDGVQAQDVRAGPREPRLTRGRLAVEGELQVDQRAFGHSPPRYRARRRSASAELVLPLRLASSFTSSFQ